MALQVPPAATVLGSATYPHRKRHGVLTEVQYAHPDGDNTNDGLSWGTAKKDVVSAYDAITAQGTIFVANLTFWDSVNTDRGLWILGPTDPNYNGGAPTLPGWRVRKGVRIVGVGQMHTANAHAGPAAHIQGGSGTDRNKPSIWVAGTGPPLRFENIHNQYPAVAWRFGVKSDLSGVVDSSGISMFNCSFGLNQIAGNGPGLELGYMYWLFMEHCTFNANSFAYTLTAATRAGAVATFTTSVTHFIEVGDTVFVSGVTPSGYNGTWTVTSVTATTFVVTLTADPGGSGTVFGTAEPVKNYRRAAIAHESNRWTSGIPSGLIHIENCNFNGGGFYYKPNGATSWGQIVMRDITHEGDFVGPEPPLLFVRTPTFGDLSVAPAGANILIQNIEIADATTGAGVEVEGSQTDSAIVTAINASAIGNVTQLSALTGRKQVGIANGEFIGRESDRSFAPVAVRYPNMALHPLSGGVWTTGIKAPDGSTNASSLTGLQDVAIPLTGAGHALGDWLIAGVWHRYITLSASNDNDWPLISLGGPGRFDNGPTGQAVIDRPNRWEDAGWVWVAEAHKVTTAGDQTIMELRCSTGNTVAYFAPMFIRILAADALADEEVFEIMRHLKTYPSTAPAGSVSTLAGQKLLAVGGLGIGNSAAATTPGSVVKKMEVFSETGASLGFVPIYNSIT